MDQSDDRHLIFSFFPGLQHPGFQRPLKVFNDLIYLNFSRQADISFHPMGIPDLYNGGVVDPIQGTIPVFPGCGGRRRADGVSAGSEVGPMVECDNT